MDTSANADSSNSPLDANQAASLFSSMIDPEPEKEREESEEVEESNDSPVEAESEESTTEDDADQDQPETVTIKVDGKDVEVTIDELKKGYQRQADYTRKTMEVAEQRKQADAERQQALQERQEYAQKLTEQATLLNAVMQEQQQIDWQQLLDSDPMEYLKQQHLYQQRQASLQQLQQEQAKVWQLQQAEQAQYVNQFVAQQQEQLLAKLPDWNDPEKAKAEKSALRDYLQNEGVTQEELNQMSDHRHVLIARKAMLYDQMMSKAKAAAKKVENLPKRVERSGNGQSQNVDKRSQQFQRLQKSGRVEDAASLFASIL
jgi:hypothetical protein